MMIGIGNSYNEQLLSRGIKSKIAKKGVPHLCINTIEEELEAGPLIVCSVISY